MTTYVIMIMDESGSMYPLAGDLRGGFNSYLDGLSTDEEIRVTAVLFNLGRRTHARALPPSRVVRLDESTYIPHSGTALLDAVGNTIAEFRTAIVLRDEDKVLVVIHTDGQENSSTEFTWKSIQDMIRKLTDSGKWEFLYIGAGAEAWQQERAFSSAGSHTVHSHASGQSIGDTYTVLRTNTVGYAEGSTKAADMADAMNKAAEAEGATS